MVTRTKLVFLALLESLFGTAAAVADEANIQQKSVNWSGITQDAATLLVLSLVGAIGGCLSAIHRRSAGLQQTNNDVMWFHCLQGAAGAVLIVTLSPVDSNIVNNLFTSDGQQLFVKFIALALIGGYAGGALLESSAGQYAKKLDERLGAFEEKTTRIEETTANRIEGIEEKASKIDELERRQCELDEEDKNSIEARRTAELILRELVLGKPEIKEFERALKGASPLVRLQIAVLANDCRRQNWEKDKDFMERSLLIFEVLVITNDALVNYWWFAIFRVLPQGQKRARLRGRRRIAR